MQYRNFEGNINPLFPGQPNLENQDSSKRSNPENSVAQENLGDQIYKYRRLNEDQSNLYNYPDLYPNMGLGI